MIRSPSLTFSTALLCLIPSALLASQAHGLGGKTQTGTAPVARACGPIATGEARKESAALLNILERLASDTELQGRLDLTSEQLARFRSLTDEALVTLETLLADARARRSELATLLSDDVSDRKQIEALAEGAAEARLAVGREVVRALLDARDVLDPDQRSRLRKEVGEGTLEASLEQPPAVASAAKATDPTHTPEREKP